MDKNFFGITFKNLRTSKGFKQADLVMSAVSKSTISSFELGDSDIQLSKFYKLIKKIGVSLEEFDYALNGYDFSDYDKLMVKIGTLYEQKNISALKILLSSETDRLKCSTSNIHDEINCAMIKCLIAEIDKDFTIDKDEKNKITDYLFKSENWSYHQLVLYNNTIRILDTSSIVYYTDLAISRSTYYEKIPLNKRLIMEMLLNTMIVLCDKKEYMSAVKFKSYFERIVDERDLFEKTIYLYLKGSIDFYYGKVAKGKEQMEKAINVLSDLESYSLLGGLQEDYKEKYE